MLDTAWRPGVDFASGLTGYYAEHEAHHRQLADKAFREWQEYLSLAEKYRLLEEEAGSNLFSLDPPTRASAAAVDGG